ncbi:MAG: extracellular solute-binding protein [Anaerolineae bacterium]|nr:extracellular solute-binding protein [Anaerolineae bacterium]
MKQKILLVTLLIGVLFTLQIAPSFAQETTLPDVLTLPDQIAGGRDVTITVTNMPSVDQADLRANWEATAQRFMDLYPNVTIEGMELEYDPAAFVALAAGGQLPTLFLTYFTEPSKFIDQGVVADLTPYFEGAGVGDVFNPSILDITSRDGAIYGIPLNAYALGLAYNIEMLSAAGYDAPPATWEELEEMATALTNRDENVAGFAFINDGSGATGWHFTNIAYGFGATRDDIIAPGEEPDTYVATYGEGPTADALSYVYDLRWNADVLPGATLDWASISEALVSGRVAMAIYAGDQFNFVYFQFPDADLSNFGYAAAPAGPNGRITLTGGNLWMVAENATDDQKEAATYFQLWRQFNPEEVKATLEASNEAIGMPVLPLYVGDYQAQWEAFREPYNILPVENYAPFNDAIKNGEVTLQPEPITAVQDYYTEVGVVVSEVLSNESVDPAARLAESAEEFQAFVLDR